MLILQLNIPIIINNSLIKFILGGDDIFIITNINHHIVNLGKIIIIPLLINKFSLLIIE